MNLRPTRTFIYFLIFVVISFLLNLSCSKDRETLLDAVLKEDHTPVIDEDTAETNSNVNPEADELQEEEVVLESRTTIFPAINDAHLQSGKGYDEAIVRLQENFRRSYLMFDLSQIDSIGGTLTLINLEFIINQDDGDGIIEVFKGESNNWSESDLSANSAPKPLAELGSIDQLYEAGDKISIDLNTTKLGSEVSTLILVHSDGDDLAFASKENTKKAGPKLIVTYDAPVDSDLIKVADSQVLVEEPTLEEETTEEETTSEEEIAEEEVIPEEETTEEETTPEEETTEEETTPEEETTEEETTPQEEPTTEEEQPNARPTAIAEAAPSSGEVPLEVTFTGNKSSDDSGITAYEWDFKDTSKATTVNAVHTFTEAGSYEVTLKVTDSEGLNSTDTVTITANAKNEAPVAKASASTLSGTAPLAVNFTGSNSTDDNDVTSYSWNFKDGSSSNQANPSHTFSTAGTYVVELTVKDGAGLSDKEMVTITVSEPTNEPPVAIASADILTGYAPLQVNFTGINSSDDNGIVKYKWNFSDNATSSSRNPSHTFNSPGVYNVSFTVTDDEGLQDSLTITITVNEQSISNTGRIECGTGSGKANEKGEKIWCWNEITIPNYSDKTGVPFSNNTLNINSECYEKQVTNAGDRLKFRIDPRNPGVESWCTRDYNMRAEISTAPWYVKNPIGTEEWYGWSYTLGNDYIIDQKHPWLFYQVHHGVGGDSPQIELMVAKAGLHGAQAGEIIIKNSANNGEDFLTGIVPQAGQTLDIVVHTIWGDESNGLLQVWFDGVKVYDKQVRTVYRHAPWGGNSKWGVYKWPWRLTNGVVDSENQGITSLEAYIGTIRGIMRQPGDADYGKNSYTRVAPR